MRKLTMAGALIGTMLFATPAGAVLSININTCVTGACGGNTTVATLTIVETAPDVITFTLVNSVANLSNDTGNTFISQLQFSYDGAPALVAGDFVKTNFTATSGNGTFAVDPSGSNAGYNFFLDLGLPTTNSGGGVQRFKNSETLIWTLSKAGIAETDFDDPVSGSGPDALAIVHIQSLIDEGSAKYVDNGPTPPPNGIPEPLSLSVFGAALAALALLRRRRSA